MRLFVALDLPYEMRRNLELLLHLLKPLARIQWSPVSNLHLTTKFIGELSEDRLDELKAALASVKRPGAMRIAIRGLGWFPHPDRPRIFYAGIQAPPELVSLARDTNAACASLGIPKEDKDYRPHLTLARLRHPEPLTALQSEIARLPSVDFGAFQAENFYLYGSQLQPGGSIYTKLASFPLAV